MTLFEQLLAEKKAKDECDKAIAEARRLARERWMFGVLAHLKGAETVTLRGDYGKPVSRSLNISPQVVSTQLGSDIGYATLQIAMDHAAETPKCTVTVGNNYKQLYSGSDQMLAAEAFLKELVKHVYTENR